MLHSSKNNHSIPKPMFRGRITLKSIFFGLILIFLVHLINPCLQPVHPVIPCLQLVHPVECTHLEVHIVLCLVLFKKLLNEILVYSRRQKTQKDIEDRTLSKQCQDTDLGSQPLVTHAGSAPPNWVPSNVFNDLDQPHWGKQGDHALNAWLAVLCLMKGCPQTTVHFATTLTNIQTPKNIQEAHTQRE